MVSRAYLDSLYHEFYMEKAKVDALSAIDTFSMKECGCSEDGERHSVALDAAKDRLETASQMITKYIESHKAC